MSDKIEIKKTDRFKLFYLSDSIVVLSSKTDLSKVELHQSEISNYTENTWEPTRNQNEINRNTQQGKIAEEFFIDFIKYKNNELNTDLVYIAYDNIRQDSFEKHAPFDGILFKNGNPYISEVVRLINHDVSNNKYGRLKDSIISFCRKNAVFLVEIKSSKIPDKLYRNAGDSPLKVNFQKNIIHSLKKLDLFKYPKFNRKDGTVIHNKNDYFYWVRNNISHMCDKSNEEIIQQEIISSLDIYTRIFIDSSAKNKDGENLIIGYLFGYVLGREFYDDFSIMNFPSEKSNNAIYVTYPIKKSTKFDNLFFDHRLWNDN